MWLLHQCRHRKDCAWIVEVIHRGRHKQVAAREDNYQYQVSVVYINRATVKYGESRVYTLQRPSEPCE